MKKPKCSTSFSLAAVCLFKLSLFSPYAPAQSGFNTNDPNGVWLSTSYQRQTPDSDVPDLVDPQSGNVKVMHKDMFMRGNGGLDIAVWRTYSMQKASAGLTSTFTHSYRWAALGPGWSIEVAPKLSVENYWSYSGIAAAVSVYGRNLLIELCANTKSHADFRAGMTKQIGIGGSGQQPIIEFPDGTVENLYLIGNHEARTKGNWRVKCSNNIVTATSPEGITYDYGNISERRIGRRWSNEFEQEPIISDRDPAFSAPRTETYMVAKTATDTNGNKLTFTYKFFSNPIPPWTMPTTERLPKYDPAHGWLEFYPHYELSSIEKPATLLTKIEASDGRVVDFTYNDTTARLQKITNNTGATVTYSHQNLDAYNSRALSSVAFSTGEVWKYSYHPGLYLDGGLVPSARIALDTPTVSARKLATITYPSGGVVSYKYVGAIHKLIIGNKGNTWELSTGGERVSSRSLSTGETWNYSYTKGRAGSFDTTIINGPEGSSTYKYVGLSTNASTSVNGVENTGWLAGMPVEGIDALGNKTYHTWIPRTITAGSELITDIGYVLDDQVRTADLQSKEITRDGATYSTQFSNYDNFGNPQTVSEIGQNGGNRVTNYTYSNDPVTWILGKVVSEVSQGESITREYDAKGNLLTESRNGVSTSFTYDNQGNISSKTAPGGGIYTYGNYKRGVAQTENRPDNITITRVVDNSGNITAETNGEGKTTFYTFDALNRVTSVTPPQGNKKTIAYTPTSKTVTQGPLIETTQYDPFGRISKITRGGISRTVKYDGLGRKVFESNLGATTGTSYTYDALNRLTRQTNSDGSSQAYTYSPAKQSVEDELGNLTTYTYRSYGDPDKRLLMAINAPVASASVTIGRSPNGLMTSLMQGGLTRTYKYNMHNYLVSVSNPETGLTVYGRDISGNMISKKVGASGLTEYKYNKSNQLISTIFPGQTPNITNTFNKNGKLLSSSSAGGSRDFLYDAVDNLIQDKLEIDGRSFTTHYTYDGNNNLSSTTYPQSSRVVSFEPDVLGRPTKVSGYISEVKYWPSGLIQSISYGNGVKSTYAQNMRLWPANFTTENTSKSVTFFSSNYTYDGVGNLKSIKDNTELSFNRTLSYDGINRLTAAIGPWGQGNIIYDGVGNLTAKTLGQISIAYKYDESNRLKSVSGTKTGSYDYDAYGNVISAHNNAYVYNDIPNLICINCADPTRKVEYTYDALNYRSSVTKVGGKSYEMYDSEGKQLIELNGDKLTEFFYLGGNRVAQQVSP